MTLPVLPRPEAILFDWDNTLVDAWGTIHEAINAVMAAMGRPPWTYAEVRARVRASLRDSFPKMFGDRWTEARDIFYATYRAKHLDTLALMPGAAETLAALDGAGLYLGVVSNKTGNLLRAESTRLGWDRHFRRLVGAGDATADKPAPDPIYMATQDIVINRYSAVWYVGDAAIDIECARRAGCTAVLVGSGAGEEAELARLLPEARVAQLGLILDLVRAAGRPISTT